MIWNLLTKYVKYTCMINNLRWYSIKIHMNDEIYELIKLTNKILLKSTNLSTEYLTHIVFILI